jgi:hypothetical protein
MLINFSQQLFNSILSSGDIAESASIGGKGLRGILSGFYTQRGNTKLLEN